MTQLVNCTRKALALAALVALCIAAFPVASEVAPGHAPPAPSKTALEYPGVLRVVAANREPALDGLSPFGPGMDAELLEALGRESGLRVEWRETASIEAAFRDLHEGRVDLVLGQGFLTPEKYADTVVSGPIYAIHRPALIQAERQALENACPTNALLAIDPALQKRLPAGPEKTACRPALNHGGGQPQAVLAVARDAEKTAALVDEGRFRLVQPFFQDVRPTQSLDAEIPYRWHWRRDNGAAAKALDAFWNNDRILTRVAELRERYTGFLPDRIDYFELDHLSRTVVDEIPKYQDIIRREAAKNKLDPLLLASVIYTESRFEPKAKSAYGAKGLLQLMDLASRVYNVRDPYDPAENIRGGSAFLRQIWEELGALGLEPWDRWFIALAGYNLGLGHVYDAMDLARQRGGTGKTWREIKETLPLLASEHYYRTLRFGFCQGAQAVSFVNGIRYYYYVLNGFVALARPEAKHLGPLLASASPVRPVL